MLLSRVTLGFTLMICLCLSSVFAKEVFDVGKINSINYSKKMMVVSDSSYQYGRYLVIQRYGRSEEERLPESYLTVGKWILFQTEVGNVFDDPEIKRIVIFDNETQAQNFYKGGS